MAEPRRIKIFSAGCPSCDDAVTLVRELACDSCEVEVLDMADGKVEARARRLGVSSVPAVAVDGTLAPCCKRGGPDAETLRRAGVGSALA